MRFWKQRRPARVVAQPGVPLTLVTAEDEVLADVVIIGLYMNGDGTFTIHAEDRKHFLARLRVN